MFEKMTCPDLKNFFDSPSVSTERSGLLISITPRISLGVSVRAPGEVV
jgi:hypothetical protein